MRVMGDGEDDRSAHGRPLWICDVADGTSHRRIAARNFCRAYPAISLHKPSRRWVSGFLSVYRTSVTAIIAMISLAACGPQTKLPPLPTPGPDMCLLYRSFGYAAAAAAVEVIDTLKKHNANESDFYDRCVTNSPKLDPARPKGPR